MRSTKQNLNDIEMQMWKDLAESAFEFLERAIAEFKDDDLKFSLIHFCSAVEQFLKARVMQNGWEEVVVKDDDQKAPHSFDDFVDGKLKTIGVGKCCKQLRGKISKAEKNSFEKLARHRNKVIHFYHPSLNADKVEIAKEQSRCWFILKRFLDSMYRYRMEAIEGQMDLYRIWLTTVFDEKKVLIDELTENGTTFEKCPACGFDSFQCEWSEKSEIEHECLVCELKSGDEAIGHCAECVSLDTVVQIGCAYYCMNCHQFCSEMHSCAHCGAANTSLRQDADGGGDVSAWLGCVECDGHGE